MLNHIHHPIKAGLDVASLGLAVGVVTEHLPYILALPSFLYSTVLLIEWTLNKFNKKK